MPCSSAPAEPRSGGAHGPSAFVRFSRVLPLWPSGVGANFGFQVQMLVTAAGCGEISQREVTISTAWW